MAKSHYSAIKLPVMMEFIPAGDGTWRARPYAEGIRPALSSTKAAVLLGVNRDSIRDLLQAGFLRGYYPTPGKVLIYVDSILDHKKATECPEFWARNRHLFTRRVR